MNPVYKLTLHKSYYDKGFFNLGVAVDKYVQDQSGPIVLRLGASRNRIEARVDRKANVNGTPRIMCGNLLRDWLQKHYKLKEVVDVHILSPNELWIC